MNARHERPEPVDRWTPGTGSGLSPWAPVLDLVERWAGRGLEAILLSGSHATGEAVWVDAAGGRVSLSDLDLYAVLRDDAAVAAAERARAAAPAEALVAAARATGLAAPAEVAFVTLAGLARMPARPGTVELTRSACVLRGDVSLASRLPRWRAEDIDAEERLLLLENRGFELLWAWHAPATGLAALRAHHAVAKTVIDLAAARCLAAGELPARARERVERARALGAPPALPSWLEGAWEGLALLWEQALTWRGDPGPREPDLAPGRTWRAAVRAWCAAWWAEGAGVSADPWERAQALAARGSLARRFRRALRPAPGRSPETGATRVSGSWLARLRHAPAGTPLLRVHGTGVVLLLAAGQSAAEPVLPSGALRALRRLGVSHESRFAAASREALAAWGRPLEPDLAARSGASA